MTDIKSESVPLIGCSLTGDDMVEQALSWRDLGARALSRERIPTGVSATYDSSLSDAVEDLARREMSCCGSWLTLVTTRESDAIRLEVTSENSDGLAMFVSMAGLGTL